MSRRESKAEREAKKQASAARDADIIRCREAGMDHAKIAELYGVSAKCVQRTLKRAGRGGAAGRLKKRERQYVLARAEGLSGVKAARAAGYSDSVASRATVEIEQRPLVRRAMSEAAQQALTHEELVQLLRLGSFATEARMFAHEGRVRETVHVIDHGMRARYIELLAKLQGAFREVTAAEFGEGGRTMRVVTERIAG